MSLLLNVSLLGASIGVSIVVLGAALGISKIGASALEAMSRQPEVSDKAQTTMIISAALIEGVALFGVLICLLIVTK